MIKMYEIIMHNLILNTMHRILKYYRSNFTVLTYF